MCIVVWEVKMDLLKKELETPQLSLELVKTLFKIHLLTVSSLYKHTKFANRSAISVADICDTCLHAYKVSEQYV